MLTLEYGTVPSRGNCLTQTQEPICLCPADIRSALRKVSEVWLISMPVAACQLVLLTAAEGQALVGTDLFASSLPLAASGLHMYHLLCPVLESELPIP